MTQGQPHIVVVLGEALTEAGTRPADRLRAAADDRPGADTPAEDGGAPAQRRRDQRHRQHRRHRRPAPTTDTAPVDDGTIAGPVESTDVAVQPVGSGLPPLGSVPGALLVGGLVLAGALGWWIQRIGGFVLGGTASCAHGLASGVPDLRKA